MIYGGLLILFAGMMLIRQTSQIRHKRPAEEKPESPFPVATVKPTVPEDTIAEIDTSSVPFHGILDEVRDFTALEPSFAYASLSDYVQRLTDEEAARIIDRTIGFEQVRARPRKFRGKMLRVQGLVIDVRAVRFDPDIKPATASGEDAWRTTIVDPSGLECWIVDLADKPPPVRQRHDLVEVEGAFLKVVRYENQYGQVCDAPFLISRRLSVIPEERVERPYRVDVYMAVAAGGLLSAVVLAAALRGRMTSSQKTSKTLEALRARRAAPAPGEGGGSA